MKTHNEIGGKVKTDKRLSIEIENTILTDKKQNLFSLFIFEIDVIMNIL